MAKKETKEVVAPVTIEVTIPTPEGLQLTGLSILEPAFYGLPELLFEKEPNESAIDFRKRREAAVIAFIQSHLYILDRGIKKAIKLAPKHVELIVDLFYGYVQKAIAWKARGTGGSLCAAIVIWLKMLYLHKSFSTVQPGTRLPK